MLACRLGIYAVWTHAENWWWRPSLSGRSGYPWHPQAPCGLPTATMPPGYKISVSGRAVGAGAGAVGGGGSAASIRSHSPGEGGTAGASRSKSLMACVAGSGARSAGSGGGFIIGKLGKCAAPCKAGAKPIAPKPGHRCKMAPAIAPGRSALTGAPISCHES